MPVRLGGIADGERFGDRQVCGIARLAGPCSSNQQALAVGGVGGETHRLREVGAGPREDRVDGAGVIRRHGEGRILGESRFEKPHRPWRILVSVQSSQAGDVHPVCGQRAGRDVSDAERVHRKAESRGDGIGGGVGQGEGIQTLDGVDLQDDTAPQVDALQLQAQRARGSPIQHAFEQLRRVRRARRLLHRRAFPASSPRRAQKTVDAPRAQHLESWHTREVRRKHLGHRGGNAGAVRPRVIPDGTDGQDRDSVAPSQADRSGRAAKGEDDRDCDRDRRRTSSPGSLARPAASGSPGRGHRSLALRLAGPDLQALRQCKDLRRGLCLELPPYERLVSPAVLDCRRPLARVIQRLHHAQCGPRAERIEHGKAMPPCGGGAMVAATGCLRRERLEGVAQLLRQQRTLVLHPAFEFGRVTEIEPVEKRPGVGLHSARQVGARDPVFEHLEVAGNDGRIQA